MKEQHINLIRRTYTRIYEGNGDLYVAVTLSSSFSPNYLSSNFLLYPCYQIDKVFLQQKLSAISKLFFKDIFFFLHSHRLALNFCFVLTPHKITFNNIVQFVYLDCTSRNGG